MLLLKRLIKAAPGAKSDVYNCLVTLASRLTTGVDGAFVCMYLNVCACLSVCLCSKRKMAPVGKSVEI